MLLRCSVLIKQQFGGFFGSLKTGVFTTVNNHLVLATTNPSIEQRLKTIVISIANTPFPVITSTSMPA
jgi:hypothetical protein